jgi:hypothetical protein
MFELRITAVCLCSVIVSVLDYIERKQWWTLRLWLSCQMNGWAMLVITTAIIAQTCNDVLEAYNPALLRTKAGIAGILVIAFFLVFRFLLPLAQNTPYMRLRWKAWTGSSRTGIAPILARYLGDNQDYQSLAKECQGMEVHPVEKFVSWVSWISGSTFYDPTELLKARLKTDEQSDTIWLPRSEVKAGVYAPMDNGHTSISLLWGQQLGFAPRCSRGIIAVPMTLLRTFPTLEDGLDGRSLCLAHGILARNKGLSPSTLICNLDTPDRLRVFEENSSLWPRPAKTLRSHYRREMHNAFSGLGQSFVTAATELALLLADAKDIVIMDWLDAGLEHQDLDLNNRAAALGATDDELSRMYRGQYAAMLVSLSEHQIGVRFRPEIMVFRAICEREGVKELPKWLTDPWMIERVQSEEAALGVRSRRLMEAVV